MSCIKAINNKKKKKDVTPEFTRVMLTSDPGSSQNNGQNIYCDFSIGANQQNSKEVG